MSDANLNQLWARALVEELVRGGAREAVVCPGSRSTPLALACAEVPGLRLWSVIDERSAGFFALGLAKESGAPALLVATSGTAGAHFYPAVIEAAMTGVPLVVLTADRPLELQGWGAPQTIPQARLFGDFARAYADVGLPEATTVSLAHLRATAARAVATSLRAPRGAVQLNVPLREPLAPVPEPFGEERLAPLAREGRGAQPFVRILQSARAPDAAALAEVRALVEAKPRGVIVCGPRDAEDGFREAIEVLSRASGYPVLAEASSQVRFGGSGAPVLSLYDALLRHPPFAQAHRPDVVLRFGGGLTPKVPQAWLDASGADVVLFSDEGALVDPAHRASRILEGSAVLAARALAQGLSRGLGAWASSFQQAERRALGALEAAFAAQQDLSEPRVAREVVAALPAGAQLFISSSMPIRDVDAFAPASGAALRVLANRGANGIDGIVSTALGAAASSGRPTALLTGDLAFLHDVGGLLTARRQGVSLTVVVVNNDGGGIFSFLPLAGTTRHFEPLFGTPHGVDLAHAAALYGARFERPATPGALRAAVQAGLEGGLHLVEVRTERGGNVEAHRALFAKMAAALGDGPWA
ncbi:2-succinyl-5-enolpyruvyl-6-hydroxy-3-cyclohexene-1-carboxylic-acid synthase [Aggregicoccus sp. 17bor-14]|uniref:2-succinyl-5-enolpyruvyl-6-hydroxy-3- cyclohexene-1-carboxylic-acid synthase n=1 Tax=Myxococcaceae TaxID=31 RepID=UPI00129C8DCA|nr:MULTISPECIES: 2-succinyl-5-enolpyruvyl-6-hydroxy-3-cyclohexene-1-carboxylic-acid synthase [Myxococcaceae]MBF5043961.1 2-succinyl-5-enolpyruvyl-6-hydroxy-3-cyclohexene-1-carboxylic-acid synthase [Simulacricoccus sp. 17bor-14]MRI89712.1 2-succinyl-5-enolpyruvyl-6-hydroxy-3-cyclohexene-1-carboxylic-acid synthase [Aggregicoccus sp. 17bor-14]